MSRAVPRRTIGARHTDCRSGSLRYRRNSAVNCCEGRPTNSQRLLNFCIWIGQGDL